MGDFVDDSWKGKKRLSSKSGQKRGSAYYLVYGSTSKKKPGFKVQVEIGARLALFVLDAQAMWHQHQHHGFRSTEYNNIRERAQKRQQPGVRSLAKTTCLQRGRRMSYVWDPSNAIVKALCGQQRRVLLLPKSQRLSPAARA